MAYGFQKDENKEQLAYARVDGVDASYRDLCNVCSNIRGRRADKAIEYLQEAYDLKRPIRYFRHNKRRGHLHSLGGRKGGYPVKSVKIVMDVLRNAMANAFAKGLADCKVVHARANKKLVYARMSAKGRRTRQDFETAFVEIVLRELQTEANLKKKEDMRKEREEAKRKAEEAAKKAAEKAAAEAAKKEEAAKAEGAKPAQNGEAKKEEPKPAEKKEAKPAEKKPEAKDEKKAEAKKPEAKAAEPKKDEAKQAEKKPEAKTTEPKKDAAKQADEKKPAQKNDSKPAEHHKKMSEVLAEQKKEEKNSKN